MSAASDTVRLGVAPEVPPEGYAGAYVQDAWLVARCDLWPRFAQALRDGVTLYGWARGAPDVRTMQGRAPVYEAALPALREDAPGRGPSGDGSTSSAAEAGPEDATAGAASAEAPAGRTSRDASAAVRVVVRHAWHGGLAAPVTRDRWRTPTRAPGELRRALELAVRGVPTPELLAYATYPAGPGLRRVDVVTRAVTAGADYGAVLAGQALGHEAAACDDAVRALLAQLAAAGVQHPDLNVKNILLAPRDGVHIAWLLDVDTVTFGAARDAAIDAANRARLARSMRKWRTQGPADVPEARITAVCGEGIA